MLAWHKEICSNEKCRGTVTFQGLNLCVRYPTSISRDTPKRILFNLTMSGAFQNQQKALFNPCLYDAHREKK